VARVIRRDQIDINKLSRALLALAQARAEADAQASHARTLDESEGADRD
jgi:hypothetical protein